MKRAHATRRSGFAMAFVLLLALVASLMIGATLTRQNAQAKTVGRQVQDYQTHHDMLGVRAVVELWMGRRTPAELVRLAEQDEAYRFEIRDVMTISVRIEDGQGLPIGSVQGVPESLRDQYERILERLPEDRRGLTRARGAAQISVNAAPAPVLAALMEDNGEDFAEEIIDLREADRLDNETFADVVRSYPNGDAQIARLGQIITFEPAVWRLRLTMTDQRGNERAFGMVAEVIQGGLSVHEWLTELDLNLLDQAASNDDDDPRRARRPSGRDRDDERTR